jgi:hypothetical protein
MLTLAVVMVSLLASACVPDSSGTYSLEEALEALQADIRLPIYALNPDGDSQYQQIDASYRYIDGYSERYLVTSFTEVTPEGEKIPVAEMMTCSLCSPIGLPEEATGGRVPNPWAVSDEAFTCKTWSERPELEPVTYDPYESCLFWMEEDHYWSKLYTIWSDEDQIVSFLESLNRFSRYNESTPTSHTAQPQT